ncbi:MAG TPA: glycosyltransferase family 2 protein [Thermoplasmata archaeon]|nr:glycosyltransferase family 2 protein [Thermoplasmata archaeon]
MRPGTSLARLEVDEGRAGGRLLGVPDLRRDGLFLAVPGFLTTAYSELLHTGLPIGAVPVGFVVGYALYRAVRFLRTRGTAPTHPGPEVPESHSVTVDVWSSTGHTTESVELPTHAGSTPVPRDNRFSAVLLLGFVGLASLFLVFYPRFFGPYDRLVGWVGQAIYWPQPWPGVYTPSLGPPLVYDYIFPMYLALGLTWLFANGLRTGKGKLPASRWALGGGLLLLYIAVELVIDSLFFTIPGDPVRNLSLVIRALTGGIFLTLVMYCTFSFPDPLPRVRVRFARDRRALVLFLGLGAVAILIGGLAIYYFSIFLALNGVIPAFTALLLLPAVAIPIWVMMVRPFYFRQRRKHPRPSRAEYHPSVTILVPAYNEEAEIRDAILAADRAAANYPGPVSLVIGNDGSTDRTSEVARETIAGLQHMTGTVVDLPHGGKSSALNGALACATGEIVIRCDADTRISEETGFGPAVAYFADPEVGGVQGQLQPRQRTGWTRKLRAMEIAWQHLFLRPAGMGARAAEVLDGAFSLFRRRDLVELGGWQPWNGEDTEISIRLQRMGYRVCLAFEAIAFEDVPPTYATLRRQRIRWTRGGVFANARHYPAIFSPAPEFGGLAVLFYYLLVLHAGARSLVYVYLTLLAVFLGLPGILHAFYLLLALIALRAVPLAYFLIRMRRCDVLPWILAWPFLGIVKAVYRFEGFGTVRYGAATEFY